MTDVFLSYNRTDQEQAKRFAEGLQAHGLVVWWDVGLKAGEDYDEVTEAALRSAKIVLVLWSPASVKSRWVRAEALLAQRLGTLVPVMIAPCERPIMFELTQTTDFIGWKGDYSSALWLSFLADVKASCDKAVQTEPPIQVTLLGPLPSSIPQGRRQVNRRALALGAGALGLVGLTGAGAWMLLRPDERTGNANATTSIAILPFKNISNEADQAYFAEGLSAQVRAELARNARLQVAAQTSSSAMKDATDSAVQIAKRLGVTFLLEGNVRKGPNTIRVNADLINGKTGFSEWTQTFDRPLDNVFEVQNEIASAVALALAAQMTTQAGPVASGETKKSLGGTLDIAAFEHFLRGQQLFESAQSLQTDQQALVEFDAAIAEDQNYAAAYTGRARVLTVLAGQASAAEPIAQLQADAVAAAKRAVTIAPNFAAAQSALGLVYFHMQLNVQSAIAPFDQSVVHGSGDGDVMTGYAVFSARIGKHSAAASAIARALSLDPLNPTVFRSAGQIEAAAHRYAISLPFYDRALLMNPKMSTAHFLRGESLFFLGRLEDASGAFGREPSRLFRDTGLAIMAFKTGKQSEGARLVQNLETEFGDASAYQQVQVFCQAGQISKALEALARAWKIRDPGLILAKNDQMLEPIRQQQVFLDLLKSIGFD